MTPFPNQARPAAATRLVRRLAIPADLRSDLTEVLVLLVTFRVLLGVLAFLVWFNGPVPGPCLASVPGGSSAHPPLIEASGPILPLVGLWQRWDACWFAKIAAHGYTSSDPTTVAFWPMFPILMAIVVVPLDAHLAFAGAIVNVCAYAIAMLGLLRLVREDFGDVVASRTVLFISVFPAAFFFFAPFSETVFLAGAVWALYGARHHVWWLAGIAGLIAGLTRIQGVFLVPVVGWEALRHYWAEGLARTSEHASSSASDGLDRPSNGMRPLLQLRGSSQRWRRWRLPRWRVLAGPAIAVAMPLVSFVGFIVFAKVVTNTTPLTAEDYWRGNNYSLPWDTMMSAWNWAMQRHNTVELLSLFTLAVFLVGSFVGLVKLPFSYSLFAIPQVILVAIRTQSMPLTSTPRLMLVVFPVFVVLALLLKNPRLERAWVLLSALLLAYLSAAYIRGDWVA